MLRVIKHSVCIIHLNDLSLIHDCHLIRNMSDHGKVMCYEKICKSHFLLKLHEKIYHLGLNTNIKGRYRLIKDQKLRINSKCSCYTNSLPLSS